MLCRFKTSAKAARAVSLRISDEAKKNKRSFFDRGMVFQWLLGLLALGRGADVDLVVYTAAIGPRYESLARDW